MLPWPIHCAAWPPMPAVSHAPYEVSMLRTLAYSGDTLVAPLANTTLAATMGEPDSSLGDLSGKSVVFTLAVQNCNAPRAAFVRNANRPCSCVCRQDLVVTVCGTECEARNYYIECREHRYE